MTFTISFSIVPFHYSMNDSNTTTNGTDIAVAIGICYEQYIVQDAYVSYYTIQRSHKFKEACGWWNTKRCTRTRYS